MVYNVENLFDQHHDEGTFDQEYMDQTEEEIQAKLLNLSRVILSVEQGQGPDVLMLAEVENIKILKRLNSEPLQGLFSTVVLIEGFDTRGIDVALLSKLPLDGTPTLHRIPLESKVPEEAAKQKKTRGILEVPLRLQNGKKLITFSVHFPSQANPSTWRSQALTFLSELIQQRKGQGLVVAGGDFNITAEEEDRESKLKNILGPLADISHFLGCKTCPGTHNYKGEWSFLDLIAVSKNSKDFGYEVDPNSIEVPRWAPDQSSGKGRPLRFDSSSKDGASDHFPVYLRLKPTGLFLDSRNFFSRA